MWNETLNWNLKTNLKILIGNFRNFSNLSLLSWANLHFFWWFTQEMKMEDSQNFLKFPTEVLNIVFKFQF